MAMVTVFHAKVSGVVCNVEYKTSLTNQPDTFFVRSAHYKCSGCL